MRWFVWVLIGYYVFNIVVMASVVGKPRKPLEASSFALSVVIMGAIITGLVWVLLHGVSAP